MEAECCSMCSAVQSCAVGVWDQVGQLPVQMVIVMFLLDSSPLKIMMFYTSPAKSFNDLVQFATVIHNPIPKISIFYFSYFIFIEFMQINDLDVFQT